MDESTPQTDDLVLQPLPMDTENIDENVPTNDTEMKIEDDDGDGLIPLPVDVEEPIVDTNETPTITIPMHDENDSEMKQASETIATMNIDNPPTNDTESQQVVPVPPPPTNTKEEVIEEEQEDGGGIIMTEEVVEEQEDGEGGGIIVEEVVEEEEDGGEVGIIPIPPPPPT
eukprot:CAMPEP_0201575762 /NCGR_PEP_ID=MMETSP0190_2-20130828/21178_1 /ASSEMBLY_ACC=CAM_ASM_000263 /TAXON_ID=37353 /ORGANISM="Rosalina sp." /LENGTH=170 /DNA_ID=CAMNT_0048005803 /DNA_START=65 /DNA_END=574 /DNA_ORIENTATION=+